jgi:hypothetical protein
MKSVKESNVLLKLVNKNSGNYYSNNRTKRGEHPLMMITDDAREFLKVLFREQNAKNIRIYFAGYG